MQNYCGMAIRQIPEQLHVMKKGIGAEDLEARDQFCPKNIHSWCICQSEKIAGNSTYKIYQLQ